MALLTPNATTTMNGVAVNEKIIPDGTVWKDAAKAKKAGFSAGSLYKKQQKLSGGTGKVQTVTIHTTNDLDGVYDDAEQYTRATVNENMSTSRVHFYVDDVGAWQNLKAGTGLFDTDPVGSAEVSWHSGDGSVSDGGNMTSVSLEIIMNDTELHDAKAKDNGARMAAWLLWKNGLTVADHLVTHTYWVNKSAGKKFADADKQCTNPVKGKKWCPAYIFGSTDKTTALKNWKAFKALVQAYFDELNDAKDVDDSTLYRVQVGSYANKIYAAALQKKLGKKGFTGYVKTVTVNGKVRHRVQVGAFSKKPYATALLAKLKAAGFKGYITTNT